MLKPVLFGLLLVTTVMRFANIIFVLTRDSVNLPPLVLILATAMVLYGIILLVKRFFSTVRIKQFMFFFMAHAFVIAFNIIYIRATNPLQISGPEVMLVGTFFDLIIFLGVLYACIKHMRGGFTPVVTSIF